MIFVFFGSLLSGGRGFLLAFSAAGQASLPWVHYEACLDLGPSSVAALGASNSAYLALFGKGLRSGSLRRSGHLEHPKLFKFFFILSSFGERFIFPK